MLEQPRRTRCVTGSTAALAPVAGTASPHGLFADACDTHCESSFGWSAIHINGTMLKDAVARWYFDNATVKLVDSHPFNENPDCLH